MREMPTERRGHVPLPDGSTDANPKDIGLAALLREDFETYERDPFDPCFWAVAVHRFGNWRMGLPRPVRPAFTAAYRLAYGAIKLAFDIDVPYTTKLGRRVRFWYRGGVHIGARSIGNDVHFRHNTTCGVLHRNNPHQKPIIEDRVDVAPGVCILGNVTVGHDSVIGANSVVVRSVPPNSTVFGVPARPVNLVAPSE